MPGDRARAGQATPSQLAGWIRGHWQIEVLHHIRDTTYGEDASQTRPGNGPQVMATLCNLSVSIFKMAGHTSIASACRHHARDATRTLATLGLSPAMTKNGHHATMPVPWATETAAADQMLVPR